MTSELRVLIVYDDFLLFRDCVIEAFRGLTVRVEDASTSAQALELLAGGHFDVTVIDYRPGPPSGIDLLRMIRSRGIHHPVILLTGIGDEQIAAEAIKAGATACLGKNALTPALIGSAIGYAVRLSVSEAQKGRAEVALADAEARYRLLFERSPYGVLLIDVNTGRAIDMNDIAYEQLGYTREEFAALTISDYEASETPEATAGHMQRIVREGSDQFETLHRTKSGEVRNIQVWAKALPLGDRLLFYAIFQDITERKLAEQSQQLQSAALNAAANAIVITDRSGVIEWVNPAFTRLTGYTAAEAMGQSLRLLKSGKHDADFYQKLWKRLSSGQVWSGKIINRRKDGRLYTEHQSITPILDKSGAITHFVAIKEDISERLHLQTQLFQAQKMESVGRLAGGVAHDFNNLLTAILGYCQVASEQLGKSHPVSEDLDQIRIAGELATSLTRQLLVFSRNQALLPEIVNLNTVVTDTDKLLRRVIGEDIEFRVVLDPALGDVMVDPTQVLQVIMNLCVNARDATPAGGTITVETLNVDLDEAYEHEHVDIQQGSYALLAVSDTGVGMDAETKSHIFEPFFTTKELGKGTGLGLATVYGIVKQSGGHIWIYSELGKGTTFKIYFPLVEEHAGLSPTPSLARVTGIGGSETVLLVDDDGAIRSLARGLLVRHGYDVIEAQTPQTALAVAAQKPEQIHLLVTDVAMPGMSGPELAMRLQEVKPGLRVLFMSGYTHEAVMQHGLTHASTHFLQKPFSLETLLQTVRAVLDDRP